MTKKNRVATDPGTGAEDSEGSFISTDRQQPHPARTQPRPFWSPLALIVLVFQTACATGLPPGGHVLASNFRYRPLTPPPAPKEEASPTPDAELAGAAELLDYRALVGMLVWTVGMYLALWLVPEPTTKALAATLTVILVGWLGLETVWGLMDGWAKLATQAHEATTFDELREAGAGYAKVLGTDAARAMIMAVATLTGRTLGEVATKVRTLPGYRLAGAQWEAQGGAAVLRGMPELEAAVAQEGAFAVAVQAVETVATSPQGPVAAVMLKKGGGGTASGGGSSVTAIRHRGGNLQVKLGNGQRWHLPRGKSVADIPARDKVGDQLQEAVTRAAQEWGPHLLTSGEQAAIQRARNKGRYWLARLLEREARGRFVHERVRRQFEGTLRFQHQGVDVVDLKTGRKYEILSGTESNLALHGRRMATEFFRMLTF